MILKVGTGPKLDGGAPLAGSQYAWWWPEGTLAGTISEKRPDICGLVLDRPQIMGIVNVTPDSFSDGGDRFASQDAITAAQRMVADGADLLDIGGESTRPGADTVPEQQEIDRVRPVIAGLREAGVTTPISIDTRKAAVAAAALDAGADMVNDVAGLGYDSAMAGLVAERGVPVCLMHAKGDPKKMQVAPRYQNVLSEVEDWLSARVDRAVSAGIARARIVIDPGIGFGKTLEHNLSLLRGLSSLHSQGVPVLLGASRKRFIGTLSGAAEAKDRLPGSLAVALHGAAHGAHFLRVHDVLATRQALNLWQSFARSGIGR